MDAAWTAFLLRISFVLSINVINAKSTIQVAFFAPRISGRYDSNVSSSIPGIAKAVHDIEKYNLLTEHELNITWYDSKCTGSESVGLAAQAIFSGKADLILGPTCSVAARPVAELAAYYNVPMFTWLPSTNDQKTIFKTLARFFGNRGSFGTYLAQGFGYMNWKTAVLIADNERMNTLAKAIMRELRLANITISEWEVISEDPTNEEVHEALHHLQDHGRVISISQLRKYMVEAFDLKMAGGDYAFVAIEQGITDYQDLPETGEMWRGTDGRDEDARKAMSTLLYLTDVDVLHPAVDPVAFKNFSDAGKRYASEWKWKDSLPQSESKADVFAPFLYDALLVYALLVNKTTGTGADIRNGTWVIDQLRSQVFEAEGLERMIVLNGDADREPSLWVVTQSQEGVMRPANQVIPTYSNGTFHYITVELAPFNWLLGHPPLDEPVCGFRGEKCVSGIDMLLMGLVGALATIGVLVFFAVPISLYLNKKRSLEKALSSTLWHVNYEDIDYAFSGHQGSKGYSLSMASLPSAFCCIASPSGRPALYKGSAVSVCHSDRKPITVTDSIRLRLNKMRELHHSNVNAFLGACLSGPVCAIWQFCSKGTLTHVLHNKNIKLDYHFKVSLITDIMRGMEYLHASPIGSHGTLTSCSVVIDARWCAKINNFGLSFLAMEPRDVESCIENEKCGALFWTAPELLRGKILPQDGTPAGDVYSFGIIFKQVLTKTDPYEEYEDLSDTQIITNVRNPDHLDTFRPRLSSAKDSLSEGQNEATTDAILKAVQSCWHEDPQQRPTFKSLVKTANQMLKGAPSNLMDNMVQMLEKYANNLEEIVDQRTQELVEEKKKTDRLLYMMLPESVAEALKVGKQVPAESFDQVTIYFSDIVGFTDIASDSTPFEIVDLLNSLYTLFDDIITSHDVYKVETIGDAYMLVSGLPKRNGNQHAPEIASCALELRQAVTENFIVPHKPELKLQIRIGLHTGSCVAGVVGLSMPRYCLFGDTVNTASRMESHGEAMKIHMSDATAEALTNMGYKIEARGGIGIKGKGVMFTYWLVDFL